LHPRRRHRRLRRRARRGRQTLPRRPGLLRRRHPHRHRHDRRAAPPAEPRRHLLMERGQPSRTAMMAATVRGLHRYEVAPPWIFDDHLGLVLVGPAWRDMRAELAGAMSEPLLGRIGLMAVTRARYTEDQLAAGSFQQY